MKKFALAMGLGLSLCGVATAGELKIVSRDSAQNFEVNYQLCYYDAAKGEVCNPSIGVTFNTIENIFVAYIFPYAKVRYVKLLSATAIDRESGKVIAKGNFSNCSQGYSDNQNAVFILDTVNPSYPVMTCLTSSN